MFCLVYVREYIGLSHQLPSQVKHGQYNALKHTSIKIAAYNKQHAKLIKS